MNESKDVLFGMDEKTFLKTVKAIRAFASDVDYVVYAWDIPVNAAKRLRDIQHGLESLALSMSPDHEHTWRRMGTQYNDDDSITIEWLCALAFCSKTQKTTTKVEKPA